MNGYDKCLDDMKKYTGTYPYNGFNPSKGDNYFIIDMQRKYPYKWIKKAYKECKVIDEKVNEFIKSL